MTPAEELAAAADKLEALVEKATAGPWTAEANSCITRLPGGVAHEFSSWAVLSPEMDDENPTTMVAGPERDPRDQKLWGGIWESVDARYIAAMNPLVGKDLVSVLRAFSEAYVRETRHFHAMWNEAARERMIGDKFPGFTEALVLARRITSNAAAT